MIVGQTIRCASVLDDGLPLAGGAFRALIADPPYTTAGSATNGRSTGQDTQFWEHWFRDVWAVCVGALADDGCAFIFCDWRMIGPLQRATRAAGERTRGKVWDVTQVIVWDREHFGCGSPFRSGFELIAFARGPAYVSRLPKNIRNVLRFPWFYGAHENHGSEKPVGLMHQLLEWADPDGGGAILDPFAGSSPVGVACVESRRPYLGLEIDEGQAERATARLAHTAARPLGWRHDPAAERAVQGELL